MPRSRVQAEARIFGIEFSRLGAEEIADLVTAAGPMDKKFRRVHTANLDHIVNLTRSPTFREAYSTAFISTIDGAPVFLYARARGLAIKGRVTGADLFPLILERLKPNVHRPFFVAARHATADRLIAQLRAAGFAEEDIGHAVPPFGFDTDATATAELASAVNSHGATHLFMGVGAPKSELWLYENAELIGSGFGFGFGAALDYAAGTLRRAPPEMRALGLEWLWRVAHEPRRLFRRYFVNSWLFFVAISRDLGLSRADRNK